MTQQDTEAAIPLLTGRPAFANAARIVSALYRMAALHLLLVLATFLPAAITAFRRTASPLAASFMRPELALARSALLLSLTALCVTGLIVAARARLLRHPHSSALVRLAGAPQALLLCTGAALSALSLHQAWTEAAPLGQARVGSSPALAVALLLAAFVLLVSERAAAAFDRASLPEAPSLAAIMRLPVIVLPAASLVSLLAGRWPAVSQAGLHVLALLIAAGCVETLLRTFGVWYAPPPASLDARAAIGSLITTLLDLKRLSPAAIGASLNRNFGIDFARSWALAFARRALVPVSGALLITCWGLTGASRIGLNQRAVYERFGAPVAILGPGLHLLLPWPFGRARICEYGIVHSLTIADTNDNQAIAPSQDSAPGDHAHAEDFAPASANRLWDQSTDESSFLVARADNGQQSFEAVSVDLRVLYRIGLSSQAARDALYRTSDPPVLIRTVSRRLLCHALAGQTLSQVMVERHDQLADLLRRALQEQLDQVHSGIDIVGLVVEALHPPAGAASAYREVQAAQIAGGTAIAQEQGRARETSSLALRDARDALDAAAAQAAEIRETAAAEQTRMLADQRAWRAGGQAFLMERRFADLRAGLSNAPLEIVDARLAARLLDLRPGPSGTAADDATQSAPDPDQATDQESRSP